MGMTQPVRLGGEAEHSLHDRQRDQLGVAQSGRDPHLGPPRSKLGCLQQQVVDLDVQCGREGVQVSVHEASHEVDVG